MAIHKFIQDHINFIFDDCKSIKLYSKGNVQIFNYESKEFAKIMDIWQSTLKNSYEIPSLGVSLDEETRKALQNGFYLEFIFDKTCLHNDMPFTSLLVEIVENQGGLQLQRKYEEQYQGRCFYLNIFEINNDLYNLVNEITEK